MALAIYIIINIIRHHILGGILKVCKIDDAELRKIYMSILARKCDRLKRI